MSGVLPGHLARERRSSGTGALRQAFRSTRRIFVALLSCHPSSVHAATAIHQLPTAVEENSVARSDDLALEEPGEETVTILAEGIGVALFDDLSVIDDVHVAGFENR